mmetsp:Transcript_25202/g.66933  ORF Transcript_25202/g.66933 Transcript_25202/m.66933 type:complete len:100 (-) Transcript_25202:23-322(-)
MGFDPSQVDPAAMQDLMSNPIMDVLTQQMLKDPSAMQQLQNSMRGGKGMGDLMGNPVFQQMARKMMENPEIARMMQNPREMARMMEQLNRMGIKPPSSF